ncbi:MAG: DUF6982 domain-containing protein [Vicinamibacterales bacterium]
MSSSEALATPTLSPTPAWLNPPEAEDGRDRRVHERLREHELEWLKSSRLKFGPSVRLIDLSAGGALIESKAPLRPGSTTALTITGRGLVETASLRVLRCEVAKIDGGLIYRGACVFDRALDLPDRMPGEVRDPDPARLVSIAHAPLPDDHLGDALRPTPANAARLHPGGPIPPPQPRPGRDETPACQETSPAGTGWNRLVVRYLDKRLLKGFSQDFHPSRQHFHLTPCIGGVAERPVLVPMPRLKAVFFVRDFAGDADYVECQSFVEPTAGRRIEITFMDDEVLVGATLGYRPDGTGFFVTPADPNSNNLRAFVLPGAVRHIRYV